MDTQTYTIWTHTLHNNRLIETTVNLGVQIRAVYSVSSKEMNFFFGFSSFDSLCPHLCEEIKIPYWKFISLDLKGFWFLELAEKNWFKKAG